MRKPGPLTAATISMLVLVCGVALAANKQCRTNDGRGGPDTIKSFAGGDTVDCGAGNDTVYYDPGDTVRDCEVRRDLQGNPQ